MALQHLLLGLLSKPASGYDLKREFSNSLQHFWTAELAQIYPLLKRMQNAGLVASDMQPSTKGPPRRVYRRTPAGEAALLEWLADEPESKGPRIHYLAQVFFLGELHSPVQAEAFLMKLRERLEAVAEELTEIEAGWSAGDPRYPDALPDADFYPSLTLQLGVRLAKSRLEWADACLAAIRERQRTGGRKPRSE